MGVCRFGSFNPFGIDDFYSEPNNTTIPNPNETITYTYEIHSNIIPSIDPATHQVSFSAPSCWAGTEDVTFYGIDPYGLYTASNKVTLTISGENTCLLPETGSNIIQQYLFFLRFL